MTTRLSIEQLALQRDKYRHLSDEEWRWFLQQVEGRERTADKLPSFAAIEDWWYPVRLSCEQCSSELTARYKTSIVHQPYHRQCLDLTAGYGVDTYFLSEAFDHTDYVEQNAELCRIAEHNFEIGRNAITVHNTTAEEFLASAGKYDLIYMDPARRDSHGGKVFRLEDCTPNLVELLPSLLSHLTPNGRLMLKLSPMLDLTQAVNALPVINWDIHVVAVKNEVKEVLLLSRQLTADNLQSVISAIDLAEPAQVFTFTREEETLSAKRPLSQTVLPQNALYLYEPNAAILKAGAYKLVAQRFGLTKLDVNTHLYVSDTRMENFPGRIWKIADSRQLITDSRANIICRNYPLTPDQLKKKLHLRDGGTVFVIGCRIAGKPTLLYAERV